MGNDYSANSAKSCWICTEKQEASKCNDRRIKRKRMFWSRAPARDKYSLTEKALYVANKI